MINFNIFVFLLVSITIVWQATEAMIKKKKIILFLPFFIAGLLFCFRAAFIFYELSFVLFLGSLKILFLIILIWIFIIIWREK